MTTELGIAGGADPGERLGPGRGLRLWDNYCRHIGFLGLRGLADFRRTQLLGPALFNNDFRLELTGTTQ